MVRGGYPEATQRESADRRAAWFASCISTILQRDVRDLARVDALHALPNLLKLLATRVSSLLNLADVSRDSGRPYSTLNRHLALLETVFLFHRLPAWSPNLGNRLVKAPKLHLVDTGLACHLIGADARRLAEDRPLLGRLLETFVVAELRKQVSWTDPRTTLFHFRTTAGSEVDVVLEKADGTVAAVEIKASATVGASDFNVLKALRDQLGMRFGAGVVLYLGDQVVPFGDKLTLVPIPYLWAKRTAQPAGNHETTADKAFPFLLAGRSVAHVIPSALDMTVDASILGFLPRFRTISLRSANSVENRCEKQEWCFL